MVVRSEMYGARVDDDEDSGCREQFTALVYQILQSTNRGY